MRIFWKRWAAMLAVIIVLVFSVLFFLWDFGRETEQMIERELHSYMEDILKQSVFSLKKNMGFLTDKLQMQARFFDMQAEMTPEEIIAELTRFADDENITRATIVALDGTVYSSEFGLQKVDPAPFEESFKRGGVRIGKPRKLEGTEQYLIDIATPVQINHQLFGTLSISYDHKNFQEIFSVTFLEGNCTINLTTADGFVISRIGDEPAPANFNNDYLDFFSRYEVQLLDKTLEDLKKPIDTTVPQWIKYKNGEDAYCAAYLPVGINDWFIATVVTNEATRMQVHGMENMASLLAAKIICIMALAALLFLLHFIRERHLLERLKDSYRLALGKSNDLFYEVDLESDTMKNHSAKSDQLFLGVEEPCYSRFVSQYAKLCAVEDRLRFLEYFSLDHLKKVAEGKDSITSIEYKVTSEQQVDYWFEATAIPMLGGSKGIQNIICIENDITSQKLRTQSLQNAARMDGLTGLYNKVTTQDLIEEFIKHEGRDGNHAMFMIDIDYFKEINDRFGHARGDMVLAQFAELLSAVFRKSDILGRMGGDEFIAFLKDYSSIELVAAKAQQVNEHFRQVHFKDTDERCKTSASIGIALFTGDGDSFGTLYKNADMALYTSKGKGKDCFTFFAKD